LGPNRGLKMIASVDVGVIAARSLDEGPASPGMASEIAGDALTVPEVNKTY
jgi:hypothetical protein